MLITSSIPNMINGVSQQPDTLRLASQAEAQVNFLSSVAEGLTVRPPTRHLAKIGDEEWTDAFIHKINRDVSERYMVVIRDGELRVFEAETGVERTVTAPNGWGYLSGAGKADYRAVSVADYTFILNSRREVQPSVARTPQRKYETVLHLRGSNFSKKFEIEIEGTIVASYETPDGSSASHTVLTSVDYILDELETQLLERLPPMNWTITRVGSTIAIKRNTGASFTLLARDGFSNGYLKVTSERVQRLSDLPPSAPAGFQTEITGDGSSKFDNYFVEWVPNISGPETGVWEETAKWDTPLGLDHATMPHILVRQADGTFEFRQTEWGDRSVGDEDSAPMPSFVGRKITDVFFFQNRLGFAADENAIMSQDGEFFDFYRSTATTVLDTDPIDIAVTSERVSLINFVVPFNKTLLLFSDQSQFVLEGGSVLAPSTVAVKQATSFESLPGVRPVGVGQFVYFPVPRGRYAGMREYFVQGGNEQNDALDTTSHVPRYLPRSLTQIAASSAEDVLMCIADEEPNALWVYSFFFNNEGKLQSAWSKWVIEEGAKILSVSFIESRLYLVVSSDGQTNIEVMSLESGDTDGNSTVMFRLDRGVMRDNYTATFDGISTTITLPYSVSAEVAVVVLGGDPDYAEGLVVAHERTSPDTIVLRGDWTGNSLLVGVHYTASYKFSKFYIRSPERGGGVSSNADGRLQLRYLSIDYSRVGFFRLRSTPRGRAMTEKSFSGRVLGVDGGGIGGFRASSGRFRVPIMCRNADADIEIVCDSHLPASFTSAEWEATYTTRARKVR